jgi:hypothetical protein
MEQSIIDPSKYKITTHSLDTRFANSITATNSEFRSVTPAPLKNIIRVRLASVEIPLVEYAFSNSNGNTTMSVQLGSSDFVNTDLLPPGNYSAATMCNMVQNILQRINSSFTCTLNPINGLVTISNATTKFVINFISQDSTIAARPTSWGLGYYLGFRNTLVSSEYVTSTGLNSIVGKSVINVQPTTYYLLQLHCPDSIVNVYHRLYNDNYVEAFAKLVLRDNSYQIQYDDGSNLLRKENTFLSPITIPFFQLRLLNPWGQPVDMLESNWSVTVEVTEVVNAKTYNTYAMTYARA